MKMTEQDFDILEVFGTQDWSGAVCSNNPDEFCPNEDIMNSQWAKRATTDIAPQCLQCPLFQQCHDQALELLELPDETPLGIMGGVVLFQKSKQQIRKALAKTEVAYHQLNEQRAS